MRTVNTCLTAAVLLAAVNANPLPAVPPTTGTSTPAGIASTLPTGGLDAVTGVVDKVTDGVSGATGLVGSLLKTVKELLDGLLGGLPGLTDLPLNGRDTTEVGVGKNGLPAGVASRIGTLIAELRDALIEAGLDGDSLSNVADDVVGHPKKRQDHPEIFPGEDTDAPVGPEEKRTIDLVSNLLNALIGKGGLLNGLGGLKKRQDLSVVTDLLEGVVASLGGLTKRQEGWEAPKPYDPSADTDVIDSLGGVTDTIGDLTEGLPDLDALTDLLEQLLGGLDEAGGDLLPRGPIPPLPGIDGLGGIIPLVVRILRGLLAGPGNADVHKLLGALRKLPKAKLDGLLSGLTKAMGGPVIGARDIESLDVEGLIADLIKQLDLPVDDPTDTGDEREDLEKRDTAGDVAKLKEALSKLPNGQGGLLGGLLGGLPIVGSLLGPLLGDLPLVGGLGLRDVSVNGVEKRDTAGDVAKLKEALSKLPKGQAGLLGGLLGGLPIVGSLLGPLLGDLPLVGGLGLRDVSVNVDLDDILGQLQEVVDVLVHHSLPTRSLNDLD